MTDAGQLLFDVAQRGLHAANVLDGAVLRRVHGRISSYASSERSGQLDIAIKIENFAFF